MSHGGNGSEKTDSDALERGFPDGKVSWDALESDSCTRKSVSDASEIDLPVQNVTFDALDSDFPGGISVSDALDCVFFARSTGACVSFRGTNGAGCRSPQAGAEAGAEYETGRSLAGTPGHRFCFSCREGNQLCASPTWKRTKPRMVISSPSCLATEATCSLTVTSEFRFTKPWSTRQTVWKYFSMTP